jgi:hypothetical protein
MKPARQFKAPVDPDQHQRIIARLWKEMMINRSAWEQMMGRPMNERDLKYDAAARALIEKHDAKFWQRIDKRYWL